MSATPSSVRRYLVALVSLTLVQVISTMVFNQASVLAPAAAAEFGVAAADVEMGAGLAIVLARGLLVAEGLVGLGHQVGARLLEIVVGVGISTRANGTARHPFGDVLDVAARPTAFEVVRYLVVARRRLQLVHRIGEDQLVLAIAMLEKVHHPFVLEQALDEIEVALVILHAIFARRIGALQPLLEFRHPIFREDLLDDLDGRHVLEDAAIGGVAEEPEPWPDGGFIIGQPILDAGEPEVRNQAAEPAFRLGLALNRHGTTQHLERIDVGIGAGEANRIGEAAADLVAPRKMGKGQRIAAERCPNDCRTIVSHGVVPLQGIAGLSRGELSTSPLALPSAASECR